MNKIMYIYNLFNEFIFTWIKLIDFSKSSIDLMLSVY